MRGRWLGRATGLLLLGGALGSAQPARAQSTIINTRRPPSDVGSPLRPLTLGASLEFETRHGTSEFNVPLALDYNLTPYFLLHFEPSLVAIEGERIENENPQTPGATQSRRVNLAGIGDTETSIEYEFLHERRYTPSLTASAGLGWPTASNSAFGDPGVDYELGLGVSKDLALFELDSNLVYTMASSSHRQNTFEASLAIEVPLSHRFSLLGEVVRTLDAGPVKDDGSADLSEGTLGWAWQLSPFTTLEQGFTVKSDGSWQAVVGWQYSFGGD